MHPKMLPVNAGDYDSLALAEGSNKAYYFIKVFIEDSAKST